MKVLYSYLNIVFKITLMALDIVDNNIMSKSHANEITQTSLARLLPVALWKTREGHPITTSNWELPMPEDVHYVATYWQLLKLAKGSIYLYAAYWDTRFNPQVIVLVYCDFIPLPELYCLLWYENDTKTSIVLGSYTYGWRPEWGGPIDGVDEPYLVSCKVQRRPAAVSLVTASCIKPTNVLAVQGSREEHSSRSSATPSIGVCLKWMRYDNDVSTILIEWIEILKAFGADTIYIYVIKVHPNTERVLHHYSELGVIDVTPLTLSPQRKRLSNVSSIERTLYELRTELLSLNDCLYRAVSSGKHQWLANIDLDEIIVPIRDTTWQKLIEQENQVAAEIYGKVDALAFANYFFLDGAQRDRASPVPGKILAHVWRTKNPDRETYVKCFHNVSSVVAAHNHYPMKCAKPVQVSRTCVDRCIWHVVSDKTARLHHYRERCPYLPDDRADCPELHDVERDDALARWQSIAVQVRNVLRQLGIPFNETIEQVMKVIKNDLCVLEISLMILNIVGMTTLHNKEHTQPSMARLLPLALWKTREGHPKQNTTSTWELPMPEDVHYAATNWQLLELAKGSIYLYACYWDTRFNPQVIVLVYCDFIPLPDLYCLLWYENDTKPAIVSASINFHWEEWGRVDKPYLASCKVQRRPAAVSLVTTFYIKPTNVLAVQGSREERSSRSSATPSIGVCLKWMRYDNDVSAILIEWIEVLKALGADTIYIYVIKVHPNTERVLHHYSALGVIDVTPFTLSPQRNFNNFSSVEHKFYHQLQQLLTLNDCLYRAVSSSKHQWLANIDLNEVIVPIRDLTWQKLVARESQIAAKNYGNVDALAFISYYFLDGAQRDRAAPLPAKVLAHVWRANDPSLKVGMTTLHNNEHTQPSMARLLPVALWKTREGHPEQYMTSNWELPMPEDVHYVATYWQLLKLAKGSIYLYAAYWDTRFNPQVIVLVYCDFIPLPELYCLLWYENGTKSVIVSASINFDWEEWGKVDKPYLVSCKVQRRPAAVSLVTTFCMKPTNVLAVQGSREEHRSRSSATPSIGVCLKWMRYDNDVSAILIEWIEILKALGADTIYFYVIKVHPNTERVLHHYSALGVIDVTPFTLSPQRNFNNFSSVERKLYDQLQQLLPLNDCLYRAVSSGKHQWLANIDLDEIIVPIRDLTWQKLVARESQIAAKNYGKVDALAFISYYFLDGAQRDRAAPLPAKILAHVWRANDPSLKDLDMKCFHNVSSVIATHNHFPMQCARQQVQMFRTCISSCNWHVVPDTTARLHHYRVRCPYDAPDCTEMHEIVRDDTLARWHSIAVHVRDVLRELGIPFDKA